MRYEIVKGETAWYVVDAYDNDYIYQETDSIWTPHNPTGCFYFATFGEPGAKHNAEQLCDKRNVENVNESIWTADRMWGAVFFLGILFWITFIFLLFKVLV